MADPESGREARRRVVATFRERFAEHGLAEDRLECQVVETEVPEDDIARPARQHHLIVLGEGGPGDPEVVLGELPRHVADRVRRPVLVARRAHGERDVLKHSVLSGSVSATGRSRLTLAGTLALTGGLLVGWTAAPPVQGATDAVCTDQHTVQFDPGITLETRRVDFHSGDGTITCSSRFAGRDVTGLEGTIHQTALLVGNCAGGGFTGTMTITFPTEGEATTLTLPFEATYRPGVVYKRIDGGGVSVVTFHPQEGDCVTTPLTEVAAIEHMVLPGD